jgi:hypothetical protein
MKKKEIDPRDRWTFDSEGKPIKMNSVQPKLGNAAGSVFVKPEVQFVDEKLETGTGFVWGKKSNAIEGLKAKGR